MSKRSIQRKLTKTSKRLVGLRAELVAVEEQMRLLAEAADDTAIRAIVAENTAADREAREASEHAAAYVRQRDRVAGEIAELERVQDELLDRLTS